MNTTIARGRRRARTRRADRPRPLLPLWLATLLAAVAAPLMHWAFPPVSVWPLAFVGIALVLLTNVGRSAWGGVLVGFVFSAVFLLIHIIWITRYLGALPWLALSIFESLLFAVGTIPIVLAYRWWPRPRAGGRPWARMIGLPALVAGWWTVRELVQGTFPYTGFPWTRTGLTQTDGPIAPVISWVGLSGLTFLMVFAVATLIEVVRVTRDMPRRAYLGFVPGVATLLVLVLLPQFPTSGAGTLRVGSAQGNGPNGYFDDRAAGEILQAQLTATEPILDRPMDVLLWPEGSVDTDPLRDPVAAERLSALSARVRAPVIVNAATTRGTSTYNTSILWEAGRGAVALHDKTHPVPFGEYVPDRWFYEALVPDLIGLIQREYTPGTNRPYFDVNGVGVGLAICFDVIYDGVVWDGAKEGAQVYMFQTNNADFRDTDENLQQLAFARVRAIETGRSVVNISTVGTSQVIAPDGRTVEQLSAGTAGAMLNDVELRTGLTPAVIIGGGLQWVIAALSVVCLLGCLVLRLRTRRQSETPSAVPEE